MADVQHVPEDIRAKPKSRAVSKAIFFGLALLCFAYLIFRLNSAAAREGMTLVSYMEKIFAAIDWRRWLLLMVAYSAFYFLIDTMVTWCVINWLIVRVRYLDIMPVRASAYVLSLIGEQVGKGAIALYLNRRDGVPFWEVGSAMLFIMFCEFFSLLSWATIGFAVAGQSMPQAFGLIPWFALAAACFFVLWILYFSGSIFPHSRLREKPVLLAFRRAKLWHYAATLLMRSLAVLSASVVYTIALRLFGVQVSYTTMLAYVPVIFFAASVPTPMRAAAITAWVILFPHNEGTMAAFGFAQHNFFILFNAGIGLLFLRRAQRELFQT